MEKNLESLKNLKNDPELQSHVRYAIIRGTYLTGAGQEDKEYYFKISTENTDYEAIKVDDICLTYLQRENFVSGVPAIIRVSAVVREYYHVQRVLKTESNGYPLLPIIKILKNFNALGFKSVYDTWNNYRTETLHIQEEMRKDQNHEESN